MIATHTTTSKYTRTHTARNTHGMHTATQKYTRNAHGLHTECTRNGKIHTARNTHGKQKCTRRRYTRNTHGNVTALQRHANTHGNAHGCTRIHTEAFSGPEKYTRSTVYCEKNEIRTVRVCIFFRACMLGCRGLPLFRG